MPKPGRLQMKTGRSAKSSSRSWFRIENAHVDDESSTNDSTKVYIYDEIGDSWWGESTPANEFIKQIAAIKTPKIELHLNSPGGDIFDGVAIYNALKAHPAEVTVIVDALAASAASFIAQAGDKVIMTKAATMMIHDGSAMAWGDAAVMRDTADLLDKLSNTVAEIYSDRAGQNIEFWRNLMIEETWYNSHEAVEAGLADEIGEDTKEEDDTAAQNKWDLSIFNYAGRGAAPDPFEVRSRIANRLKEMTVGRPTNQGGDEPQETGSPEVDPNAQTTEGQTAEVDEEREDQNPTPAGAEVDGDPAGTSPPSPPPANKVTGTGGTFVFSINGQQVSDPQAVQSHITKLENFQRDSVKAAKVGFVEQLAADNKILATQIEKITNYVLGLTDEQYDAWKDTWDGAASHPMFAQQAGGVTNPDGPQSQTAETAAKKVEDLKEVVAHLRRGGLSDEKIENTGTYRELVALDPTFKL